MAVASTASLLISLRLDSPKSNGALPLSLPKPTWVVRTESNVRRERKKKPDPPCVICKGSGRVDCHYCYGKGLSFKLPVNVCRVDCHYCYGKGRINQVELEMLPKGEWPKWCKSCGGSGLGYCSRCLGTGEYRYIMGFHFMKRDDDGTQDNKSRIEGNRDSKTTADRLLHCDEQTDDSDNRI